MLELHDKSQFRIIAYSYGPSIIDEMRARVVAAVDEFRDVRLLGDQEIVDLARQDAVDIAVDLKGFTSGTRFGIFALRAAPIQVSYLGYPGTTGASCMDYVIADQTVIPTEQQENFSEKIIYLPNCYQVNDNTREISTHSFSRSDFGLPDQAFVFCCFNQSYKIGPEEFDVWMSLLRQIDGSVLWLLETNGAVAKNLRKEASRRSVSQDRLIFAARAPLTIHLARHRLADLFLDTFNVNAHTTASDALWSGLPVITRLGKGFSARVAGSLLKAIELPELIAESTIEYKNLAYMLANSPSVLDNIREKLDDKIISSVLFDSNIFTRHMEKAYAKIFDETFDGYF
jgi:protein O-GlcNAc transferase